MSALTFERKNNPKQVPSRCSCSESHPKKPRAASWVGHWAGRSIGDFCEDCKDHWLKIEHDILNYSCK